MWPLLTMLYLCTWLATGKCNSSFAIPKQKSQFLVPSTSHHPSFAYVAPSRPQFNSFTESTEPNLDGDCRKHKPRSRLVWHSVKKWLQLNSIEHVLMSFADWMTKYAVKCAEASLNHAWWLVLRNQRSHQDTSYSSGATNTTIDTTTAWHLEGTEIYERMHCVTRLGNIINRAHRARTPTIIKAEEEDQSRGKRHRRIFVGNRSNHQGVLPSPPPPHIWTNGNTWGAAEPANTGRQNEICQGRIKIQCWFQATSESEKTMLKVRSCWPCNSRWIDKQNLLDLIPNNVYRRFGMSG